VARSTLISGPLLETTRPDRACPALTGGRSTSRQPVTCPRASTFGLALQQLKRPPHRPRLLLQLTYNQTPAADPRLTNDHYQTLDLFDRHPPTAISRLLPALPRLSSNTPGSPLVVLALAATTQLTHHLNRHLHGVRHSAPNIAPTHLHSPAWHFSGPTQ
jgi:hypothetical protein